MLCCLLLCSYIGKPLYQAKLTCRNKGNRCHLHLSHNLQLSIKDVVVTWFGGSVDISISCRFKNINRSNPDSIDFKILFMTCSNGIPIQQEEAKANVKDNSTANPGIYPIPPSGSVDTVLHFFSQGRYSRSAAIATIRNDLFFLHLNNRAVDTLGFAAVQEEQNGPKALLSSNVKH